MGCPDDYTIQAVMRWGYPEPQDPRIDDLRADIAELEAEIARLNDKMDILREERDGFAEELCEKRAALESLEFQHNRFMDI